MPLVYSPPVDLSTLAPHELADDLRTALNSALPLLRAISEQEAGNPVSGEKWSRKQVLGHLIDSAANNLQRFVRLQIENELRFPSYQQEGWVAVQNYHARTWNDLIVLWEALNLHLAHIMQNTAREHLGRPWIREDENLSLGFIMQDYTGHLRHHLKQIL